MNTAHKPHPKTITALLAAGFLVLALTFLPGCASMSGGGAQAWLADLRDTAQMGAGYDLSKNPGHRTAYAKTIAGLDDLMLLQNLTPLELYAVLENLPIKQLKGDRAILYVTGGQFLMRRLLNGRPPVEVPGAVRDVAGALRDGLKAALTP